MNIKIHPKNISRQNPKTVRFRRRKKLKILKREKDMLGVIIKETSCKNPKQKQNNKNNYKKYVQKMCIIYYDSEK